MTNKTLFRYTMLFENLFKNLRKKNRTGVFLSLVLGSNHTRAKKERTGVFFFPTELGKVNGKTKINEEPLLLFSP